MKQFKKLALRAETVAILSGRDLQIARGGLNDFTGVTTCARECPPEQPKLDTQWTIYVTCTDPPK